MKLPKFIKNTSRCERQQNLQRANRQLLLSEMQLQPQKCITPTVTVMMTPKKVITTTTTIIDEDLYQIKQGKSAVLKSGNTAASVLLHSANSTGRYVKCAQPKRLQRNRVHVTAKPANYVSRSTLNGLMPAPSTPLVASFKVYITYLSSKLDQVKEKTPIFGSCSRLTSLGSIKVCHPVLILLNRTPITKRVKLRT